MMIRKIFVLFALLLLGTEMKAQDSQSLTATFSSYEEETFYFMPDDSEQMEFSSLNEKASAKYDLTKSEFKGKRFKVTYIIETETDASGEEIDVNIITDLERIE
ncbi:hypothetical protein [Poritiphilus flavus]|uniref:Uncharacterized protein n=1 Tax=Poritiphilus flavus TaxID=2697053 RepID=A0A6L9EC41_9FLAO|nr:hypothetical protein [Poritiphilus flavus]NAS12213.1 hypothetical protein [Poritiphilus flavus]